MGNKDEIKERNIQINEMFKRLIEQIKRNKARTFNEDGSIVKSVTMASYGAGGAAAPMRNDTLDVKLNQPFIYIIRDINAT